jgi:6-phosphofructo-2-kinase
VKLSTPDYRDMDPEAAVADFRNRREMYLRVYEPVADEDGPYIKIINSKQFIGRSTCRGRTAFFLSCCSLVSGCFQSAIFVAICHSRLYTM